MQQNYTKCGPKNSEIQQMDPERKFKKFLILSFQGRLRITESYHIVNSQKTQENHPQIEFFFVKNNSKNTATSKYGPKTEHGWNSLSSLVSGSDHWPPFPTCHILD